MNPMKHLHHLLALLLLPFLLLACEQDNYEKGEGEYSQLRADFVEAHTNADKQVDYVVTDEGDRLTVEGKLTAKWLATADSVYRAYLYYNRVGTAAQEASIGQVATLKLRRPSYFKEGIATDPVRFESMWLSTTKRYLNASVYLMMGHTDDEKAIHSLGLVGDTIMVNADSSRTWHTRLWHSQGGIPEYYSQRIYLSIPLYEIDADSICVDINTYSGTVERKFPLR